MCPQKQCGHCHTELFRTNASPQITRHDLLFPRHPRRPGLSQHRLSGSEENNTYVENSIGSTKKGTERIIPVHPSRWHDARAARAGQSCGVQAWDLGESMGTGEQASKGQVLPSSHPSPGVYPTEEEAPGPVRFGHNCSQQLSLQ